MSVTTTNTNFTSSISGMVMKYRQQFVFVPEFTSNIYYKNHLLLRNVETISFQSMIEQSSQHIREQVINEGLVTFDTG